MKLRAALGLCLALGCSRPAARPPVPEALAPAVPAAPDESFRATPPASQAAPALHAPVPTRTVLPNGLTVLSLNKPGLPLVHAALVVRSGAAQDPASQEGLAGFTGDMLEMGTRSLSAAQLAQRVEALGTSIDVEVDEDATTLSTTALQDNFAEVFKLLADMAQAPALAPQEVERVRKSRSATLAQGQDSPQYTANATFRRVVFGSHAYGHLPLGNSRALAKIQRSHVLAYHRAHYRPANAALVLVGSLSDEAALALARDTFGAWQGSPAPTAALAPPRPRPAELALVSRPDAAQSQVVVGHLGVARSDADYFPLVLCNAILGGTFNSRINMNLREAHGYTYGTYSHFDFLRERGAFAVAGGIRTDATEPALREILKEIDSMRDTGTTEAELTAFKSRYTVSLPSYFQTVGRIADMFGNIYLYDLPLDYYQQVPDRINAVNAPDVQRVARAHILPGDLSIVVVGDRGDVAPGLAHLGRGLVRLRKSDGDLQ